MPKTYDRSYFDKWYRDPSHAVGSPAELRRKVAMALAQTEYYLGRTIRNVLDVGCGEAAWRAPLRALRPGVEYRGLDASEYVVARYGRSRQIGLARFGQLEQLRFDTRFDLIVCSDVLHYLKPAEIRAGLHGVGEMLDGAGDEVGVLGHQRVGTDHAVRRHRADHDRVAVIPYAAQRLDPAQVDDPLRGVEPHPHHREQALPAGQDLGVVAMLLQGRQRLLQRGGREVVEGCRDHWSAPVVRSTVPWVPVDGSKCGIAPPTVSPPEPVPSPSD